MRNPIETTPTQSIIKKAVEARNPDLLTHTVWSAFYQELYEPLTEIYDSNVVLNQFTRDQYLIRKAVWESHLLSIKNTIQTMDTSFDDSEFKKNKQYLSPEILDDFNKHIFKNKLDEVISKEDLQLCFDILSRLPHYMMTYDARGYAPLHRAILSANAELFAMLSSWGNYKDIKTKSAQKSTPLHLAVSMLIVDKVRYLLAIGANVNIPCANGETSLHKGTKSIDIIKMLVAKGAMLDARDNEGYTPLYVAVEENHVETARFLFEMGADIQQKTKAGKSVFDLIPAHNAALFQFLHEKREIDTTNQQALFCFEYLACHRAYPEESSEALHAAYRALENFNKPEAALPKVATADSFFHCPKPVVSQPEHQTALMEACRNADLIAFKQCIETGGNLLAPDKQGRYAFSEAIWHLAPDIVSWILNDHASLYTPDNMKTMLLSIKHLYQVNTVLPVPSPIKTFHDWRLHWEKQHAPWFYYYQQVKNRETCECPVSWGTIKHVTAAALPFAAKENHPFIKLEFTAGGRVSHTKEAHKNNIIAEYPEYNPQIEWLHKMCLHMKDLLNSHGVMINNDFSLEKIELSGSLNRSIK